MDQIKGAQSIMFYTWRGLNCYSFIFIIFIVGIFAKNYYEFIYIFGKLFQILTEKKLKTRVLREMQGVCFIYG